MLKILIKYDDWGRMGNRMFLYAFGKILAERKDATLFCEPLPNFINTHNEIRSWHVGELNNPISLKNTYGSHYVDYEELLATNRDIIVDSYLQKAIYYTSYIEKIRKWFEIINPGHWIKPIKSELVVHIRETDYKTLGILIDESFYIDQLKKLQFMINATKLTIVTDNCNSNLVKILKEQGANVLTNEPVNTFKTDNTSNIMQDYYYMLHSNYLVMSQSTFSWWPAFLGEQSKVFIPITDKKSAWKMTPEKNDVDLIIKDNKFSTILVY